VRFCKRLLQRGQVRCHITHLTANSTYDPLEMVVLKTNAADDAALQHEVSRYWHLYVKCENSMWTRNYPLLAIESTGYSRTRSGWRPSNREGARGAASQEGEKILKAFLIHSY
jgi:hypothetical protein